MEFIQKLQEEDLATPDHVATLDEPVSETLKRDARMVGLKLFHVVCPHGKGPAALRDWDLWGPLVFCFFLAAILAISSGTGTVFTIIFMVVAIGSVVVCVNARLVGTEISFFQCVSVLGYCIFPLDIAALICFFIPDGGWVWFTIRFVFCAIALAWCTWATVPFFGGMAILERRTLVIYPVFLFYMFLMFMVLVGKEGDSPSPSPSPSPTSTPTPTPVPTPVPTPSPSPSLN